MSPFCFVLWPGHLASESTEELCQSLCHLCTLPTGLPSTFKMHGPRAGYPGQLRLSFRDRLPESFFLLWNNILNTRKRDFFLLTPSVETACLFFLLTLALAWVLASLINRGSWMHPQPPDVMVWGTLQLWEVSVNLSNWWVSCSSLRNFSILCHVLHKLIGLLLWLALSF